MIKIKSKKGITVVSLVFTIVIISILTTVAVYSQKSSNNIAPYNKMLADISLLEDEILIYYNKNGELPIKENTEGEHGSEIDLSKLKGITLNFGTDPEDANDRYYVNNNLEIYYLDGIEKAGVVYHTKD